MADSSRDEGRAMRIAHRLVARSLVRRLRATVRGRDQVPDDGPLILVSNHVSNLDNYLLSAATPRPPWFLGKAELADGLFGRFNQAMGMVPVARGKGDWAAIETAVRLLRDGHVVALFPEGTRSPTGELYKFRSGLARIAAASDVPVLPVGLVGTRQVWPPGVRPSLRRPRPGVLEVNFGELLPPPEDTPRARRDFTNAARDAVASLSGQVCARGYAPLPQSERPDADADAGHPGVTT
jgi:1-acyl-sn-glycerol-3-phosphate acyltransferase